MVTGFEYIILLGGMAVCLIWAVAKGLAYFLRNK